MFFFQHHPDRNLEDSNRHDKFVQIKDSYDILSNEKKRKQYNDAHFIHASKHHEPYSTHYNYHHESHHHENVRHNPFMNSKYHEYQRTERRHGRIKWSNPYASNDELFSRVNNRAKMDR